MDSNEPKDDSEMLFHECAKCNCRCNCSDQPCSCCQNKPSTTVDVDELAYDIVNYLKRGDQSVSYEELHKWVSGLIRKAITEATQGIVAERDELRTRLNEATEEVLSMRMTLSSISEQEASVCPEDVGFVEYINRLTAEKEQLKAKVSEQHAELMNYAVNVCPDQDRIIAELQSRLNAMVKECQQLSNYCTDASSTESLGDAYDMLQAIIEKYKQ